MIGVVAGEADLETVREFFELFKTPWELAVPGSRYRVLLVGQGADRADFDGDLILLYGADARGSDRRLRVRALEGPADVSWDGETLPVYGGLMLFDGASAIGAWCDGRALDVETRAGRQTIHRIGYDLFGEVRRLLSDGQPVARALTPTVELHIALLRAILVRAGVTVVEIPPRPFGYDFTCCLTHDLDFYGIRRHAFDRTLAGFFYRTTIGTLVDLLRGRRTLREAAANWRAGLTLPFVLARLQRDPWHPIEDYARAEAPHESTFFVVPFSGRPGAGPDGAVRAARAVRYQARDVADDLRVAAGRGSEVALHGIDAWRDPAAAALERDAVTAASGAAPAGVRMHWLYYGPESPAALDTAGFSYDSTCGYNDAVGFRAGTAQVFRPAGCRRLLELPLSVMDSALLFPTRMNKTPSQAATLIAQVIAQAARFGGVLVVNWHDRSLAPERLWSRAYAALLAELRQQHHVWFATAGHAVDWYRWRRAVRFVVTEDGISVRAGTTDAAQPLPAATVTVRNGSRGPQRRLRLDPGASIHVSVPAMQAMPWQLKAI